ncbi:MAG: hypothetical protein EOO01_42370 [Chitinophagaceae bacterium]|nr:MAG: hypothetical protein EOO01_42370 [Chitinophagaceae bacterium]
MLTTIFLKLVSKYTRDTSLANNLWLEIFTKYSDAKRHYHNIDHLDNMIQELTQVQQNIQDWETTLFAVFYHDIVYDVTKSTNEAESAALAKKRLTEIGFPMDRTEKCMRMILATKAHGTSEDSDTNFLLDADLAIFGGSPDEYYEYTQQIRQEYSIYPDFMYDRGRKKVLRKFLKQKSISTTKFFRDLYETNARINLESELEPVSSK